jgi:hypothetical protein
MQPQLSFTISCFATMYWSLWPLRSQWHVPSRSSQSATSFPKRFRGIKATHSRSCSRDTATATSQRSATTSRIRPASPSHHFEGVVRCLFFQDKPLLRLRCLLAFLVCSASRVPIRAATDNNNVVQALRAGGVVIVVRHGATFPYQADTDPLNFDNIAAQRNLNDNGKALAKTFGNAIRHAGVPIGKVYTAS